MQKAPVAVFGASGYAGLELVRLLAAHPGVDGVALASDRWGGEPASARIAAPLGPLRFESPETVRARASECALVLLATPAEASHALVPELIAAGARVIDLSGAFRLREPARHAAAYGFSHAHPELLADAAYGLPELGAASRAAVRAARLVANPGCYATAIQLALAPLVAAGVLGPGRLVADAVSGATGAGRKASEELAFCEVADDVRAYRTLRHQHAPEIAQGVGRPVAFVPHLVPLRRGILATCHAELAPGAAPADAQAALARAYAGEPFVELAASADDVGLRHVVGTNRCRIGLSAGDGGVVVTAAIDTLVKGAAGQAVQNANLLLGLPEPTGLDGLRSFWP